MNIKIDNTATESTIVDSNNTHLKHYTEEIKTLTDDKNLEITVYVVLIFC